MVRINWDEFKDFRAHRTSKDDNFTTLIYFMKSYYNMVTPTDIFDSLIEDELAVMMLEKREITSSADLESFMLKM
jgi:hypothetical protein